MWLWQFNLKITKIRYVLYHIYVITCFQGNAYLCTQKVRETRLRLSRSASRRVTLATERTQELEQAPLHSPCTSIAAETDIKL